MKSQWTILLISALTDAFILFATAIGAAMMSTGVAVMPSASILWASGLASLVAFLRTVQQALKATPAATAELKGEPPPPPAR